MSGVAAYLPVKVAKHEVRFLIDTGASVTILSTRVYERMWADIPNQLRVPEVPSRIQVADNGLVETEGEITLELSIGGHTFTWDVLVAPIADEGMLGLDFLCAQEFAFNAD